MMRRPTRCTYERLCQLREMPSHFSGVVQSRSAYMWARPCDMQNPRQDMAALRQCRNLADPAPKLPIFSQATLRLVHAVRVPFLDDEHCVGRRGREQSRPSARQLCARWRARSARPSPRCVRALVPSRARCRQPVEMESEKKKQVGTNASACAFLPGRLKPLAVARASTTLSNTCEPILALARREGEAVDLEGRVSAEEAHQGQLSDDGLA